VPPTAAEHVSMDPSNVKRTLMRVFGQRSKKNAMSAIRTHAHESARQADTRRLKTRATLTFVYDGVARARFVATGARSRVGDALTKNSRPPSRVDGR